MAHIFTDLNDIRQRTCLLLLDEVYVKATFQYHRGIVSGKLVNKIYLLANTMLILWLWRLFGGLNFLCKILPVKELDSKIYIWTFEQIFNVITNAGGKKVAIICTGNQENRGFFKMIYTRTLTYHWNHVSSVYVHLTTNVRKNWRNKNCMELDFHADGGRGGGETKTATWYIAQFWSQSNCEIIKAYRSVCLPQAYLSKGKEFPPAYRFFVIKHCQHEKYILV